VESIWGDDAWHCKTSPCAPSRRRRRKSGPKLDFEQPVHTVILRDAQRLAATATQTHNPSLCRARELELLRILSYQIDASFLPTSATAIMPLSCRSHRAATISLHSDRFPSWSLAAGLLAS
jgi:hypothetical protein